MGIRAVLVAVAGTVAVASCDKAGGGRFPADEPLQKTVPAVPPLVSDPSCPAATTFAPGLGPNEIPFCILVGKPPAPVLSNVAKLRSAFNQEVRVRGDMYCSAGGCAAQIVESDSLFFTRSDSVVGWDEITIRGTGGRPPTVGSGLNVYAAYVLAKSPNVACRAFELDPKTVQIDTARLRRDIRRDSIRRDSVRRDSVRRDSLHADSVRRGLIRPPEPPPKPIECADPSPEIAYDSGTKLAAKSFILDRPDQPLEDIPGLKDFVETQGPAQAQATLDSWLRAAQAKCPPGCEAYFDPVPIPEKRSGTATVMVNGKLVHVEIFELHKRVRIRCKPKSR